MSAGGVNIVIGHAAWHEPRRENFDRLVRELEPDYVHLSKEPEHANVWARDLWRWASIVREPTVILNDDVDVCPSFRHVIGAMLSVCPFDMGLHTTFPGGYSGAPWVSSYWYTGPAVLIYPEWAKVLLRFWDDHLDLAGANEDMIGIYAAYEHKKPYWHPVPSPVRHRTDIRSTLGYDKHPHRVTTVPWTDPRFAGLDLTLSKTWAPVPSRLEIPWMTDAQLRTLRKC